MESHCWSPQGFHKHGWLLELVRPAEITEQELVSLCGPAWWLPHLNKEGSEDKHGGRQRLDFGGQTAWLPLYFIHKRPWAVSTARGEKTGSTSRGGRNREYCMGQDTLLYM